MAKKYNSQATIEAILSVSERLFLVKGFDKTSMKDIAETAGISKGAIYHHFQSKDEIIEAVMEKQAHTVTAAMEGWLAERQRKAAVSSGKEYRKPGSSLPGRYNERPHEKRGVRLVLYAGLCK